MSHPLPPEVPDPFAVPEAKIHVAPLRVVAPENAKDECLAAALKACHKFIQFVDGWPTIAVKDLDGFLEGLAVDARKAVELGGKL